MPLTEKRIASLTLRYIAKVISPEEKRELMEGYVNLSTANRLAFERMVNFRNLLNSLRDFSQYKEEADRAIDPGPEPENGGE